jgi:hypothetical protein
MVRVNINTYANDNYIEACRGGWDILNQVGSRNGRDLNLAVE